MTTFKKITAPTAMTNIDMTLNLNGYAQPVGKEFAFAQHTDDAEPYVPNPETYTSTVSTTFSDQNGNEHTFSTYFAKTDTALEWNAYAFIDGRSVDTPEHRIFFATSPVDILNSASTILPKGEITANPFKISFGDDGKLSNVDDIHAPKFIINDVTGESLATTRVFLNHVDLSAIDSDLKSEPLDIALDFTGSTQFAMPFQVSALAQSWLLMGTDGNDSFAGSAGNDTLIGGLGVDKLTGSMGADVFTFLREKESGITTKTRDIITDFKYAEGDRIDVSAIDANSTLSGDQSFTFIGAKNFSNNAAGQLRFDAEKHTLYGSTDADEKPEFSIQLNGVKNLVVDDLVL